MSVRTEIQNLSDTNRNPSNVNEFRPDSSDRPILNVGTNVKSKTGLENQAEKICRFSPSTEVSDTYVFDGSLDFPKKILRILPSSPVTRPVENGFAFFRVGFGNIDPIETRRHEYSRLYFRHSE